MLVGKIGILKKNCFYSVVYVVEQKRFQNRGGKDLVWMC